MSKDSFVQEDVIRASEIGEYVHCHRAWWLGHVQGVENVNRAWMDAGTERHRAHGQQVVRATLMQNVAVALIVIALIALLLLVLRFLNMI